MEKQIYQIHHPDGWVTAEEPKGCFFSDLPMVTDAKNGMIVNASRYPRGFFKPLHRHGCSHGIFVIEGMLRTDHGTYGPGTLGWHPAGCEAGHGSTEETDCLFLFIANKPFDIEFLAQRSACRTPAPEVFLLSESNLAVQQAAVLDDETGMSIRFIRFEKGTAQNWQRSCACGLYIMEGMLTADGRTHEPGTLIWLPEGSRMQLETFEESCCCLCVTNG